ncbi:LacI family DNA-binding transcriptional regulator [Microbacterium resistens]|uniref:LacI family transcriptional regulator n=1 Tax=Microbacterium resistens TaxID=156977 RepID=A0ABY3RN88_9MICO|nr:LacI family DNA-binding transcriptional regulator [Microbacterium resistens]MBW1640223.1 LacI family transcriptional regulator [Microbacterium resistens]MDA4891049.1 LacI family DNA-binding transcriptional regulator [Streptomyces sp. MS2A]UGS25176.1 LacI family transcriptional regulator [Microbacterium resistens]
MAVSVREVAEDAGVSVGTVSNVLNRPERVSADTVARVHAAIERLGYVRNDAARQLRAGRSRTIGLVVLDIRNPFFAEVVRGAEGRAEEHGRSVLVANSDEKAEREATHLALFEEQRVSGVLITPVGDATPLLGRMHQRGIPSVLVDRRSSDPRFASVSVDDGEGGRIAAAHLLSLGRRRLAFVGGPLTLPQVSDRLSGAQSAAAEAGAAIEFLATRALTVEEGRRAGELLLQRAPAERPDGVFAANDLVALGILQSMVMTGGARVPEDLALIGYDDIDFAAAAVIPLSSVRQPASLIGATAVDLLLGEGEGLAEPVRYRPELVVRASTTGR